MGTLNNKNIRNEMTIIYKINYEYKIKIFGNEFIKNNKKKCKIIMENKEYNIFEFLNVKNRYQTILKIKLKEIKTITNMSSMFSGCNSLISLDTSNWNMNNVINMSSMFSECKSLTSLPDISNWNTNNVTNMSYMFYKCESLVSLPDISKWNTSNINNMNFMFSRCFCLIIVFLKIF